MFRFVSCAVLVLAVTAVSANSRFARQIDQTPFQIPDTTEASGLQFIDFSEGSASNPIVARDQEGSGAAMYNEEGSGSNQLLFDAVQMNETATVSSVETNVFQQVINITDTDVETLMIKVHLPQRTTNQLINELKDDSEQQTNPMTSLDTAVSLTSVLNDLLARLQNATNI